MFNGDNSIIRENDVISLNNRREYQYQPLNETKGKIGTFKGYDIQVVDIKPGDTILFHLNDNVDVPTCEAIVKEMAKTFPECTIIPVNEWVLKGMTILRNSQPAGDSVDLTLIDRPLEEEYPELFKDDYWYWQGESK